MRARLALAISGIEVEHREVVLRDKPPAMLAVSPKGTVPVLVLPGSVLEESEHIMLWALQRNDPEYWLHPELGTLDDMLLLIARTEDEFKPNLDRYKYSKRYENVDSEEHRGLAAKFLLELNSHLKSRTELFGDRRSLAGAAIAPFVRQFANADRAWFDSQPWSALRVWLDKFLNSPLFLSVMQKHPQWVE